MGNIEYKKTLTIKGKIIKEDDVLRIAHLLHSQFRTGDYTEEYEILFEDQSSLTGNDSVAILSSDEFRKGKVSAFGSPINPRSLNAESQFAYTIRFVCQQKVQLKLVA